MDALFRRDSLKNDAVAGGYVLFRDLLRIDGFREEHETRTRINP